MGKMQRTKGHSYERDIALKFRALYPEAKRKLEYQIQECTGVDLENVGPFLVQCKRFKKYAPISHLKEVQGNGIHLLITRGDFEKDVVCMYLEDFLMILRDFKGGD